MWVDLVECLSIALADATAGQGTRSGRPQAGWLVPIVTGDVFSHGSSMVGSLPVAAVGCAAP